MRMTRLVPMLLVMAFLATACLGGSGSAAPTSHVRVVPRDRLEISVRLLPGVCNAGATPPRCRHATPTRHRYSLTCAPAGGTMPDPPRACAALADLRRSGRQTGGCIGVTRGPGSTAAIAGVVDRHPFHLPLDAAYSWCGPPAHILRDFWILSTFPCGHVPLHMAHSHFSEAIGCRPE